MKINYQANSIKVAPRRIDDASHYVQPEVTPGVLSVVIPYTTPELTRAALRHAGVCSDLNVHVSLVDVQVVPYPCAIDQPPVNREYSSSRLQELFRESGLRGRAEVVYTRDLLEGFKRTLEPGSLVIIAARKRWWPTREERLARELLAAGHQVMLLRITR
jgi:hypothetical protein